MSEQECSFSASVTLSDLELRDLITLVCTDVKLVCVEAVMRACQEGVQITKLKPKVFVIGLESGFWTEKLFFLQVHVAGVWQAVWVGPWSDWPPYLPSWSFQGLHWRILFGPTDRRSL